MAGGMGVKPPQLWTEMMLPLPCACMSSVVSSASRHVAIRLTSSAVFHTASSLSQMPLPSLRSEEHTSELQSLMRISYAVFCLKKKTKHKQQISNINATQKKNYPKEIYRTIR